MPGHAARSRCQVHREAAGQQETLPELRLIEAILARAAADLLPYTYCMPLHCVT